MLILEDPEGKLGISDVTNPAIDSRFKPNRHEDLNLGLTQSAFWMKFEVTNRNESQENFVLVCQYRLIDHFDVYIEENEQWRVIPGGDQHPRNSWSERQRTPFVSIDLPSGSSRTIYIRARSEGSVQLPVYIFTPEAFAAEDRPQNIWGGLVFGVFVFVILYSLLYGIASRSATQIAYSIFLTGLGLFVITQSGIGQALIWGPANVITNRILVLAGGIALIGSRLFFVRYLNMDITQPRLKYALYGSAVLGVVLILTAIFLPYRIGAILLIPCAIYDASVVFLANIVGAVKKQRQAITGLIAWSVACAGFVVVALQYAGLLPRDFFIENANILGVLFGITLQSLAVADRVLFLQRQQIEAAEKHNLELEQKIEERTREVRQSRNEIELLAEFTRRINETTDIERVLDEILEYFETEYGFESVVVSIVDAEFNELQTLRARYLAGGDDRRSEFVRALRIPLTPEGGALYSTFRRQRPFYVRRRADPVRNAMDLRIVDTLGLRAFGLIPLVIQNQTIGIVWINSGDALPGPEVRRSLERFCQQIAGAVHSATLLVRFAAARNEIEQLAEIARRATEDTDTDAVLNSIFAFLERTYGVDAVLFLADPERKHLRVAKVSRAATVAELEFLNAVQLPISDEGGVVSRTFIQNRTNVYNSPTEYNNRFDELLATALRVRNYAHIPLRVKGDVIGVLSVTGRDRSMLFSEPLAVKIERFCTQIAGAVQAAALLESTERARAESDRLLISILPRETADELKAEGRVKPQSYESVSVFFSDFVGFTRFSESLSADRLVQELDGCFSQFDEIVRRHRLEKLKTIGDAYMCAGGLPRANRAHAVDVCLAALEMLAFTMQTTALKVSQGESFWQIRIGIHSGPVTAGVIGATKFAYDIWGDTVNTASRMESGGAADRINISGETFSLVKDFFECEYRGKIDAKGKGALDMYFLNGIRPELASDSAGLRPNAEFEKMRAELV